MKKYGFFGIAVIFTTIFSLPLKAQLSKSWEINFPMVQNTVKVDPDGYVYGCSHQASPENNDSDVRVWKISKSGDVVFEEIWSYARDIGLCITKDEQENILILGKSTGDNTEGSFLKNFLIKYDAEGNRLSEHLFEAPTDYSSEGSFWLDAKNGRIIGAGIVTKVVNCDQTCKSLYTIGSNNDGSGLAFSYVKDNCPVTSNTVSNAVLSTSNESYVFYSDYETNQCWDNDCKQIYPCQIDLNARLLKLTASGTVAWDMGTSDTYGLAATDNLNNLLALTQYGGDENLVITNYIQQFLPNGIQSWSTTINYTPHNIAVDDNNNIITTGGSGYDTDEGVTYHLVKYDGDTGAEIWHKTIDYAARLEIGPENKIYTSGFKTTTWPDYEAFIQCFSSDGAQLYNQFLGVGYYQQPFNLLGVDNEGNVFTTNVGYNRLVKYSAPPTLTIYDALGEEIPDTEFDMIKIANDPPNFTEEYLGKFTTDFNGQLGLVSEGEDSVSIELDEGTKYLTSGDMIKVSRQIHTKLAVKHQSTLPDMYSVHLDNLKFDDQGTVSFNTVGDDDWTEVILDHTELRYSLLVSVEWDAEEAYLLGLQDNIIAMSNYLYDVTDGQVRLDKVAILDNKQEWGVADIQVHASNVIGSYTYSGGIYSDSVQTEDSGVRRMTPSSIVIPRRDYTYFDPETNRDPTYIHHPLSGVSVVTYRVLAHEFGHYALGFYDEYLFCCNPDGSLDNDITSLYMCPSVYYYGYMHSLDLSAGERTSEMSSGSTYSLTECQNTNQYIQWNMSCWDLLEFNKEGSYNLDDAPTNNIWVPIIKPNESERDLPDGLDYFPGPNNSLGTGASVLDYNVGNLIDFTEDINPPAPNIKSLHVQVKRGALGIPQGGAIVKLNKTLPAALMTIEQGKTTDSGKIWVLGANADGSEVYTGVLRHEITAAPALIASLQGNINKSSKTEDDRSSVKSDVSSSWLYARTSVTTADSVEMTLAPINGYYPIICEPILGNDNLSLSLHYSTPFQEIPSLTFIPDPDASSSPTLSDGTKKYNVIINDNLGVSGELEFEAVDALASNFRFWMNYSHTFLDTSDLRILGPKRLSVVEFNNTNKGIERALLITSPYPVIRSGLNQTAVQAGETQSFTIYPESTMKDNAVITIHYDDNALKLNDGHVADESSLQIYKWNISSSEWILVGGYVDVENNTVWSAIPEPGIYAAFTSNVITGVNDVEDVSMTPYHFNLHQNYPNPFGLATTIEYNISKDYHVKLDIYNVSGQKVRTLIDRLETAGEYKITWDGKKESGEEVSPGIYLYRFSAGDFVEIKRMILLK